MRATASPSKPSFGSFLFAELKGYLRAFFLPIGIGAIAFLLWCAWFLIGSFDLPPSENRLIDVVGVIVVCLMAVPYLATLSVLAGSVRLL